MNWQKKIKKFLGEQKEKVAFFVNISSGHEKFFSVFGNLVKNSIDDYRIIFFGSEIPSDISNQNLNIILSEELISREDCEEIDDYVFNYLSRSWYLYDRIEDYKGINLGRIVEYDFQKYLSSRIKNLEILKRASENENGEAIIVVDDTDELSSVAKFYESVLQKPVLQISLGMGQKNKKALLITSQPKCAAFLNDVIDSYAFKKCLAKSLEENSVLFDIRFLKIFKNNEEGLHYLPVSLERGLITRLKWLKNGFSYFPLSFSKQEYRTYEMLWKELASDLNFQKIFAYRGISIWELVKDTLLKFIVNHFPRIRSNIDLLEEIYSKKKIDLVVLRNDVKELERTIVLTSKLFSIPTLVIQHGVLAEVNGHNLLLADKFAAWGEASVSWYGKFNELSDRFFVTGNPKFDSVKKDNSGISKKDFCEKMSLDVEKRTILFATQQINKFSSFWADDIFYLTAEKILETIRRFPNKQLIIKADPYEDPKPYVDIIKRGNYQNAVVIKDVDIYELFPHTDLLITLDSTVGLEAMLFRIPLITFNLTKRQDRVPYAERGAALGVYKAEDLGTAIQGVFNDSSLCLEMQKAQTEFIKEFAYRLDGKSTKRLQDLILNTIPEKKVSQNA